MGIKRTLTRALMRSLPADEQARTVARLVAWVCADLPLAEQRKKIEWLGPKLIEMIRQGRFGLQLLVYTHLLRLPPLRWLIPAGVPPEGQPALLAARGTGATSCPRLGCINHAEPDLEEEFKPLL